jgi:TRAP-type mannitol/chloroaromatic compound transport system permease large subunit
MLQLLEAHMSANRRLTMVIIPTLVLLAGVSGAVVLGMITASTGLWIGGAVVLGALIGARFHRHAELPDSVKLH